MKKITWIIALLVGFLLNGCTTIDENEGAKEGFVGKTKTELIKALGEPKYSIDSTFDDERASRTIVYATKDPSRGCVESYKIDTLSQKVIEYACR